MSYQKIRVYNHDELKDRFVALNDVLENYRNGWDNYESLYATAQKYGNYHNETITLYYKNTILKREVF